MEPFERFPEKALLFWKDQYREWNTLAESVLPHENECHSFLAAMERERESIDQSLRKELGVERDMNPRLDLPWNTTRGLTVREMWIAWTRIARWMLINHGIHMARDAMPRLIIPGQNRYYRPVLAFMKILNAAPAVYMPIMDDPRHDISVSAVALVSGGIAARTEWNLPETTRLREALGSEGRDLQRSLLEKLPGAVVIAWKQRNRTDPILDIAEDLLGKVLSMVEAELKSERQRKLKRGKVLSIDEPYEETDRVRDVPDRGLSPEQLLQGEEFKAELQRLANKAGLSRGEAEVLELMMADPEWSPGLMAKTLRKPANLVYQLTSRLRAKLRRVGADRIEG